MRSQLVRSWSFAAAFVVVAVLMAAPSQAARPDAWVTTKVKMALFAADGVPGRDVRVDTADGRVSLHGAVASAAEKQRAEEVARGIEGVREVRNLIQVDATATRADTTASDDEIESRVSDALDKDRALAESDIEVKSVNGGVVTLGGEAKNLSEKRRALQTAANVPGVRRTVSEISGPETLSDDETWREGDYDAATFDRSTASDLWITSAAKMRLLANTDTPGFDINVDTSDGVVTLFGTVASDAAKREAEAEVRKVGGVKNVENALQVVQRGEQESVTRADDELASEIDERIEQREELADVDDGVQVENGVARLTGTVEGPGERMAALRAARSVPGVRRVIDDLKQEPPPVSAR